MNPVFGAVLHLQQYLSSAALVKARAYSSTLPAFMLAVYKRSAAKGRHTTLKRRTYQSKELIARKMTDTLHLKETVNLQMY